MANSSSIIADRYARALFDWLEDRPATRDAVHEDIQALLRWTAESPEFNALLREAVVYPGPTHDMVDQLLSEQAQPETLRFLHFLINKRRMGYFIDIAQRFDTLVLDARGIAKAECISATPLTEQQLTLLRDKLKRRLGQTLHFETRLDPALISGFQIRVRDTILDYSVRAMLETFRRKLLTAEEGRTYGH